VDRPIVGFERDADGAWVALLNCGHRQHMRHEPPFTNRIWVTSEEGRHSRIGVALPCVQCDRLELPEDFIAYSRTPLFSEETVPVELTRDHTTKAGIWAKIVVVEGRLRYHVNLLETAIEVGKGEFAIVVPEVPHFVEPVDTVQFYVEFFRAPGNRATFLAPG
jgi:tellurite methyltransferase